MLKALAFVLKNRRFIPYVLILIFGTMWYFEKDWRLSLKSELNEITIKYDSVNILIGIKDLDYSDLEASKTSLDTFYSQSVGNLKWYYEDLIKETANNSAVALNEPLETHISIDTSTNIKTLIDTVSLDNSILRYKALYSGLFHSIKFDWQIEKETIVKENVVYKTIYQEIEIPERRSYFYASYLYGGDIQDINLGYISKRRIGIAGGVSYLNKNILPKSKVYPKIGVIFVF